MRHVRCTAAALLLLASFPAFAQVLKGKERFCAELSTVYMMAAQFRDSYQTPQAAYQGYTKQSNAPRDQLTDQQIKDAINNTYFKQAFQVIPSDAMYSAVNGVCLDNGPKYTPLK